LSFVYQVRFPEQLGFNAALFNHFVYGLSGNACLLGELNNGETIVRIDHGGLYRAGCHV